MKWMYHKDQPDGRVFADDEKVPAGWVDSPAKLKEKKSSGDRS